VAVYGFAKLMRGAAVTWAARPTGSGILAAKHPFAWRTYREPAADHIIQYGAMGGD
jgi:hypothetical protein